MSRWIKKQFSNSKQNSTESQENKITCETNIKLQEEKNIGDWDVIPNTYMFQYSYCNIAIGMAKVSLTIKNGNDTISQKTMNIMSLPRVIDFIHWIKRKYPGLMLVSGQSYEQEFDLGRAKIYNIFLVDGKQIISEYSSPISIPIYISNTKDNESLQPFCVHAEYA